ncbi:uncharacterized protein LOC134813106 isoform X2 [Bolinopsis microptera]|uniref:uncharacterized protein LOC134813106 isoform X2 n=1 Tax=Bolinopsis microptera TaxID=2820187 RepID=UPI00307A5480
MASFQPQVLNKLNTTFKDLITDKQSEVSGIVLTCFTYLLIALGVIMLLKLYFQTVFIFAKYFPIVTLPLYVVGAWAFSALLFYMAWDMGYGVDDNGNIQKHIMTETFATVVHQGLIVGAVFLMIAPFTLLMPRLRFGRSSSDNEGCCRTICFPTFVWVVFLFIVLLAVFSGYCLYMLLREYYQQTFFNSIGVEGIYVLIVLFYLFALFQILAQRKIIVSGENILGELRKPFKCLHSRPYLFVYISVLIFFSLAALGVTAFYGVKAFDVYKSAEGDARTTNIAIVGAFSGMAAVYVLIGMALGLVISCSRTQKSENPAGYPSQTQPLNGTANDNDVGENQPYTTVTENTVLNDRGSYQQREYNDYNMDNNTLAGAIPGPSGRPPLPPRLTSTSNNSSKHSLIDTAHTHHRTTSKHSIKAVDLSEVDKSPYSSLGQPSLPRKIEDIPRPYHFDLATMTMPAQKPAKGRFHVPSGLANMLHKRRGSKDSRKSFGLKRSSSSASTECRASRPFSIISTGTVAGSSRALEDDYIPPPPAPLLSPELPPPPPPMIPATQPNAVQPAPTPLHLNLSKQGSTGSCASRTRPKLHSPATPSSAGMDRHWSVEFEGRMRTLSQNKLTHVKQKDSKYFDSNNNDAAQ